MPADYARSGLGHGQGSGLLDDTRKEAQGGYTFELQGMSDDVTVENLHALFDNEAPSIRITMNSNSPQPPIGTSTTSPLTTSTTSSSSSASYLLKPPGSFNRSADLRVDTLGEAIALQNMQPRLEPYGLSLTMRGRTMQHTGATRGIRTGMGFGQGVSYGGAGWAMSMWRGDGRDDSGMSGQYGAGAGGPEQWRDSRSVIKKEDVYMGYESDDHIPVMSTWSPWGNDPAPPTSPFARDAGAERDRLGPRNLYVLNLPVSLSQLEFQEMFANIGRVEHACLLSMLDSNGRRRGFVLMQTHREAREVIKQMHGRWLEGFQLDISWSKVQKGTASEIQRGSSQGPQRFLPPPLAPPHQPVVRHDPVSYPAYRPSTGWTTSTSIARHPEHPVHIARTSPPSYLSASELVPKHSVAEEDSLATIIVVQPALAQCSLHAVTTEASKYGVITHSCVLSLGQSAFAPFDDYGVDTLPSSSAFATSFAIRFHHAASAATAARALPQRLAGWRIRPAEWSDIDRLSSNDRQLMLYQRGIERSLSNLAPAPMHLTHLSMVDALHAKPFLPSTEIHTTPKANRKPVPFTTPISPLSDYPKFRQISKTTSNDRLAQQASIWQYPEDTYSWSKLRAGDTSDADSDLPLPPTPIIKSIQPETTVDIVSPSAVWWTGALRIDNDDTPVSSLLGEQTSQTSKQDANAHKTVTHASLA